MFDVLILISGSVPTQNHQLQLTALQFLSNATIYQTKLQVLKRLALNAWQNNIHQFIQFFHTSQLFPTLIYSKGVIHAHDTAKQLFQLLRFTITLNAEVLLFVRRAGFIKDYANRHSTTILPPTKLLTRTKAWQQ